MQHDAPRFDSLAFLPAKCLARITDVRVSDPERTLRAALARRRRPTLAPSGRLNIIAADHPARHAPGVGDNPLAMADRRDLLARIVRVLAVGAADGVLASTDILEELLVLDDLVRESGGRSFLDDKALVASRNRGGLAGACWELDDPWTGPDAADCCELQLDAAKFLLRVCLNEPASLRTIEAAAEAVRDCTDARLPLFLEPLPVVRGESGFRVVNEAPAIARLTAVASALGSSSRWLWLKLPACDDFAVVARATTLPILILGGEVTGPPTPLLEQIARTLGTGDNVRGAMIGRNALYPTEGDPAVVAGAIHRLVHAGAAVEQALDDAQGLAEQGLDAISAYLHG